MNIRLVSFLLRTGLAVVFGYAAVASLLAPDDWIGFLPPFLRRREFSGTLLVLFSIYEIALALWLLSNKQPFRAAAFAALTMVAIIIPNILVLDVIFRDAAILFMALGLMTLTKRDK